MVFTEGTAFNDLYLIKGYGSWRLTTVFWKRMEKVGIGLSLKLVLVKGGHFVQQV